MKTDESRHYYDGMQESARALKGALWRISVYQKDIELPIATTLELVAYAAETARLAAMTMATFYRLWRDAQVRERRSFAFGHDDEEAA